MSVTIAVKRREFRDGQPEAIGSSNGARDYFPSTTQWPANQHDEQPTKRPGPPKFAEIRERGSFNGTENGTEFRRLSADQQNSFAIVIDSHRERTQFNAARK
jgi:hypothetical protein